MNIKIKRFFFGLFTFIVLLNLIFSDKKDNLNDFNRYFATFNKIDGVLEGTDVLLSGIKVGQVEKVSINKNYPQISMLVKKNIAISDDSSVSIQTDGLFGKKFLLIEVGGNDKSLGDGDNFSFSEDSIVIEELLQKIIEIGEKKKKL